MKRICDIIEEIKHDFSNLCIKENIRECRMNKTLMNRLREERRSIRFYSRMDQEKKTTVISNIEYIIDENIPDNMIKMTDLATGTVIIKIISE